MGKLIGQRWEVYQYDMVENFRPKKGETVMVKSTPEYNPPHDPDFGEAVIPLTSNNGKKTIAELYDEWTEGKGLQVVTRKAFLEHDHSGGGAILPPQIKSDGLATDSVITSKMKDNAVTLAKIADITTDATGAEAVFAAASQTFSAFLQKVWRGITWLNAQVKLKAPIASPTFTGTVKVPNKTSTATNDGTLVATEAQVFGASATINNIIKNHVGIPEWDGEKYILKFTAENGQTLLIDLPIESLAAGLDYDAETKEMILARQDGSEIRVSVSDLIDVYSGSTGEHIQVTVESGNVIKATLLGGSITEDELSAELLAKIECKADYATLDEIKAGFYTKDEVDEKLQEVEVDLSDYYNKTAVDEKISNVEVDLTDYYTKSEADTKLTGKSDEGHTHTKSDITDFSHIHSISDTTNLQTALNDKIDKNKIGVANGLATLDNNTLVPIEQLPISQLGWIIPDYANKETVNRISTNNGTWTVEKDGFIYVTIAGGTTNGYTKSVTINNVIVAQIQCRPLVDSWLFPVKKGDIVKLANDYTTGLSFSCYYIPPRNLMLQNYSLEEQDAGQRWIDGKPIYQKTYQFNTASSNNAFNILDTTKNINNTLIIKQEMFFIHQDYIYPANFVYNNAIVTNFVSLRGSDMFAFLNMSATQNNVLNKPAFATVWYIKK